MKTNLLLTILAISFLGIFGCQKDPLGPNISVLPSGIQLLAEEGDLIEFDIDAFAGDNSLRNLIITSKPDGGITSTLLDTSLVGSQASFFFIYTVPAGSESILMSFTVYDEEGLDGATGKRVNVEGAEFLNESTGHQLYSTYASSQPDAFDLDTNTPLILSSLSDSSAVDITELDELDDDALTLKWTSLSGAKFVRNNSFNYPEATYSSAQNTFEASTALQVVTNIAIDDILITEYDTIAHSFAVIKITDIQELAGSEGDRYVFNVKK